MPRDLPPRQTTTLPRLVEWVYRVQRADLMSGKGLTELEAAADGLSGGVGSRGASNAAAVLENGLLGTLIPSTAHQQAPALHPDAEAVHDLICAIAALPGGRLYADVLMRWGRRGGEPPERCTQSWEPVTWAPGREMGQVVEVDQIEYRSGCRHNRVLRVMATPVQLYPSDAWAALVRQERADWLAGLRLLESAMHGVELIRWEVSGN